MAWYEQDVGQCLTLCEVFDTTNFFKEIEAMPSRMMKTKTARKVRQARKGKARKRAQQNKGTTPVFPIHIKK